MDSRPRNERQPQARNRRIARNHGAWLAILALAACGAALVLLLGCSSRAASASGTAAAELPARSPEAIEVTPPVPTPGVLTVAAVGDMQFDRGVRAHIARNGGAAPFASVASYLRGADVTIGNLESSLSDRGRPDAHKDVTLEGAPRGVDGLAASGFDVVSMANNHVLDYGPAALADTVKRLNVAGIRHAGAGADASAAWRPAIFERRGMKIAFLSFSDIVHQGFAAGPDRPGLAAALARPSQVLSAIRSARKRADLVIVAFHWGVEYSNRTTALQVSQAHAAIDAGADLVLAHHPHVLQGVELYRNRLIAYSLGDFVFDHFSRATGESYVLLVEFARRRIRAARLVPVFIAADGTPEIVSGDAAAVILGRLASMSAKFGTHIAVNGASASVVIP